MAERFLMLGIPAGREFAVQRLVLVGAAGGEADGTRLPGPPRSNRGHSPRSRRPSRVLAGNGALAQTHRPRRDDGRGCAAASMVPRQPQKLSSTSGETLPVHFRSLRRRDSGDVLHSLHQIDNLVLVTTGQAQKPPPVARHDGRGAVPERRRGTWIPSPVRRSA